MERVIEAFNQQGLMQLLGAEIQVVEPGAVAISVLNRPELRTHHGLMHGGVIATIADTASGFAAFSMMPEGRQPLTVEFKINFLAKALGDGIVARASVKKHGKTLSVVACDVFCFTGSSKRRETETLCSTSLVTIFAIDERAIRQLE